MKFTQYLPIAFIVPAMASGVGPGRHDKGPKDLVKSKPIQNQIKTKELMSNLQKLQKIANNNGGNRAFGLPGYKASVDYILSRTKKSKDFITYTQEFEDYFAQVEKIDFRVDETSYHVVGLTYSPSTSDEGLTAPLVLGATGPTGCTNEGYANLDVKDKIVLVQRGSCPDGTTLAGRLKPAAAAGAAAVVIYNDVTTPVTGGTLSDPESDAFVSAGFINKDDGEALKARIEGGEAVEAFFVQIQVVEKRKTWNVITETKQGNPTNTIMLGAHLDSVQAGAGINDDGSGTSLLLEVKEALEKFKVRNKVRFAWWGAEENGLLGSKYYVSQLNDTAANNILAYLNFDMVGRGYYGVFDGDGSTHGLAGAPGSDVIEKLFVEHLEGKGINVTAARFTGGSDYQSFMNIGKPVGGMHTGTGVEQDPCYHQECDNINNPNPETLTINAKAAAHVLSILATEGHKIIPKSPVNEIETLLARSEFQWTHPGEGERHVACGNDI